MVYIVECYECRIYKEFATYREAELYCGENNIHCENIYEIGGEF